MEDGIIILGAGGHGVVLLDALMECQQKILGFVDPNKDLHGKTIMGYKVLGDDSILESYDSSKVGLVNGVGSTHEMSLRKSIFVKFKGLGYHFATIVHPSAIISKSVKLAEGVQVLAGCVIQVNASIGENTIINTKTSVDHDCVIGSHIHLAPGVTVSGNVTIKESVHVGTGACIIQDINIGSKCLIGAGSVVIKDVNDGAKYLSIGQSLS
ncbi:sugar acetyltransferase [bacterium K02(2017)]|nr:sugar acetyltransferase [bacterium K02(2017)]